MRAGWRERRERRNQLVHPAYTKPELLAIAPNQVWSWDITKLKGPAKWTCFHLYVILDIFSRHVVGWLLAERESAELAEQSEQPASAIVERREHPRHPIHENTKLRAQMSAAWIDQVQGMARPRPIVEHSAQPSTFQMRRNHEFEGLPESYTGEQRAQMRRALVDRDDRLTVHQHLLVPLVELERERPS